MSILGSSTFLFDEQQAWLIDSGASSHLVGEGMLSSGHVEILEEHAVSVQCSLASGEPITLRRKVDLKVLFVTVEGSLVTARLSALVAADCSHAILSTGQMALRGWEVSINAEGVNVSLRTNDGHHVVLGSCIYGNVGWCYSVPCGLAASLRDGSRLGRELNRGGDATGVHGGTGWLRESLDGALSNRAWSTVTSKSPASQKANSDSDSPVDHGKETPQLVATDETPWIEEVETPAVFVKAVPEMIKGPQLSITEPKVARSKARPPPPVLPFRRFRAQRPRRSRTPEPDKKASGSTDPVGACVGCHSEATAESEGGPSREDPRPERAAAGTEAVELGEPPSSHASEGPEAAVEIPAEAQGPLPLESSRDVLSEEKKVPSDCWWIVTDKEALGNFSMFEHELLAFAI